MKKLILLLAVVSTLAFLGCGQKASDSHNAETPAADTHADTHAADHSAADADVAAAAYAVGDEVTLAGTIGCGHCNFSAGEGCSAAVQTADGGIYILDVEESSEAFQARMSGKPVEVVGTISAIGEDASTVTVASIKL